jgi:hypothetical protein
VPGDLTGCTGRLQLRSSPGSAVLLEASTANGKLVLGDATGTVKLNVTKADMAQVSGPGVFEIEISYADGSSWRFAEGTFETFRKVVA